jgi:hypothetical protein
VHTVRRVLVVAVAALVLGAVGGGSRAATQAAPTNTSPPTISGEATIGSTLTADPGSWSGATPITYAYRWLRCGKGGGNCSGISNATQATYQVRPADGDHTLRVRVTAKNSDGSGEATSAPTAVVPGKPVNTALPAITGSPEVGATLTAAAGTWAGATPITFAYSWLRCGPGGSHCSHISGTSTTYQLRSADVAHTIRVRVVAKNVVGSTAATSAQTPVIKATPPPPTTGCPSGSGPVDVASLSPPAHLAIDGLSGSPSPIGRNPGDIVLRFHVSACGGRPVGGALVYATAVPFEQFSIPPEAVTGSDGWSTLTMHQEARYPASPLQQLLAVFVRARKRGENVLGGISARRLVSFKVDLSR